MQKRAGGLVFLKKAYLILFMLLVSAEPAGASFAGSEAVDFRLNDQFDRPYTLASLSRPVILLASDRDGEEQSRQWGELIGKRYGSRIQILGVADVRSVPFFLKSSIKKHFRKDKRTILLDWDGILFKGYGLTKGVANVIMIDSANSVRHLSSGGPSEKEAARLFNCIEAVLREQDNSEKQP